MPSVPSVFQGYAFVTMGDDAAATSAIADLNGQVVDGQEIKVDKATGRGGSGGGGGGSGGRGGGGGGGRGRGGL